jgi:hypothetical protein
MIALARTGFRLAWFAAVAAVAGCTTPADRISLAVNAMPDAVSIPVPALRQAARGTYMDEWKAALPANAAAPGQVESDGRRVRVVLANHSDTLFVCTEDIFPRELRLSRDGRYLYLRVRGRTVTYDGAMPVDSVALYDLLERRGLGQLAVSGPASSRP